MIFEHGHIAFMIEFFYCYIFTHCLPSSLLSTVRRIGRGHIDDPSLVVHCVDDVLQHVKGWEVCRTEIQMDHSHTRYMKKP